MADELLTERLRLRRWSLDDLEELTRIFAEPEVWRFPSGEASPRRRPKRFLARRIQDRRAGHGSNGRLSTGPAVASSATSGCRSRTSSPSSCRPSRSGGGSIPPPGVEGWRRRGPSVPDPRVHGLRPRRGGQHLPAGERGVGRLGMRFDRDTRHPGTGLSLRVPALASRVGGDATGRRHAVGLAAKAVSGSGGRSRWRSVVRGSQRARPATARARCRRWRHLGCRRGRLPWPGTPLP